MNKMILPFALLFIMTGCEGNSQEIAKIPEASGICFSQRTQTLFVAEDEGKVFEIDTQGKILRKKRLGNYDLEGVACDDVNGMLLFAVEGEDTIMIVSQKKLKIKKSIKIKRKYQGNLLLKRDKKNGLEGITIVDDFLYVSNQADPSVVLKVAKETKKKVTILDVIKHGHSDIAGLSYHDKHLFMVSDSENLLIKYDLEQKKIVGTAKLPIFSQEGVTFDDAGYIYFANDEGSVLKYKREKFGL